MVAEEAVESPYRVEPLLVKGTGSRRFLQQVVHKADKASKVAGSSMDNRGGNPIVVYAVVLLCRAQIGERP